MKTFRFLSENFNFLVVKFSINLNRRVFVVGIFCSGFLIFPQTSVIGRLCSVLGIFLEASILFLKFHANVLHYKEYAMATFVLPRQIETVQMSTNNICILKKVRKKTS